MDRERHFLETVRENRDRMYRVAMGFLHAEADAEDAVSCAVVAAYTHLHRLRQPEALPGFFYCSTN